MNCGGCFSKFDMKDMYLSECCGMFRCEECYTEHHECYGPRFPPKVVKITKVKRLQKKQHKPVKVAHCDDCHREFPKCDLIVGPDPYASEIGNNYDECTLCKDCYRESCWSI